MRTLRAYVVGCVIVAAVTTTPTLSAQQRYTAAVNQIITRGRPRMWFVLAKLMIATMTMNSASP
jgi:hypothetical protein